MQRFKLGVAPIAWSNDDMHELGGATTLESCLKDMQSIGYTGTERGHKFPATGAEIKAVLDSFQLTLASSWHSSFFLSEDFEKEKTRLHETLKVLKETGASCINVCECTGSVHGRMDTSLRKRPEIIDRDWGFFTKKLSEAGSICSSYGIQLTYHHHMGTVIQDINEVTRLLENTDPQHVFLCFDSGHFAFSGSDPVHAWDQFSERVRHIHLKVVRDWVCQKSKTYSWSFLQSVKEGVFTVPNDGMINFNSLLKKIEDSSYSGWLIVEAEQDPAKADPFLYASKAYEYLSKRLFTK